MGLIVSLVSIFHLPSLITLIMQIAVGIIIYIGASKVLRLDAYEYLISMIGSLLKA